MAHKVHHASIEVAARLSREQSLFAILEDVRDATYWWKIEYNEERPQDALGNMTPAEARLLATRNSIYERLP